MKFVVFLIFNLSLISCTSLGDNHDSDHEHTKMDMSSENSEHWNAPANEAARQNPITSNKDSINRGSALYQKRCASCHGVQAIGDGPAGKALNPKPADLKKMAGNHPDGDFAWKIATGRGAMPPWKSILTENEIWEIVNYIQSLSSSQKQHKKESEHGEHSH